MTQFTALAHGAGDYHGELRAGQISKRVLQLLAMRQEILARYPNQAAGPTAAGAVATPAQGGDAVWVDRLTPAERAALKKFFK